MTDQTLKYKTCRRWNVPWQAHELTFSCYRGHAFLSRPRTCEYLAKAILQAQVKHGFSVWGYVFMPEHAHLLIWPQREQYSISDILKSIKQSVSRRAVAWLKASNPAGLGLLATRQADKPYQFWQDGGGYDRNVRRGSDLMLMLNYIHNNPVARGLVARPEDWEWSSARDWADLRPGPIPLDKESFLNSII